MAVTVDRERLRRRSHIHYLMEDWPESMVMDDAMFERYAMQMEREDFEDELRNLSSGIRQLTEARKDTILKLRASADYLDSIWLRCRVSRSVGTSASLFGGGLTIAGGILTLATLGAATPVLIAGIATSSVGAATNIGTTVVEKILNSKQIKEMNEALNRDREITLKIESQMDDMRRYKESAYLTTLLDDIQRMLGPNHVLAAILQGILVVDSNCAIEDFSGTSQTTDVQATVSIPSDVQATGVEYSDRFEDITSIKMNGNHLSEEANPSITPLASPEAVLASPDDTLASSEATLASSEAALSSREGSPEAEASTSGVVTALADLTPKMKYNPLDAGVLVEGGKVIGQNSFRLAGQVIIGISAAFLVWDAIDLGFTVSDLVKKKGSEAAMVLRDKADILEAALLETQGKYDIDIPD